MDKAKVFTQEEVVNKVFHMMITQAFVDWQKDVFEPHVEGVEGAKEMDDIFKDLEDMLF